MTTGTFVSLLVSWTVRWDPLSLRAPRTVATHAQPGLRSVDPYLIFLHELGARLPHGASVWISPGRADPLMDFWIASGQLPANDVISPNIPAGNADYIASRSRPISVPGYRLVDRWPNGFLYRK